MHYLLFFYTLEYGTAITRSHIDNSLNVDHAFAIYCYTQTYNLPIDKDRQFLIEEREPFALACMASRI